MKYQIMTKFTSDTFANLWQLAGDTVTTNGVTTFTPWVFEDIDTLKEKVLELDAQIGSDNIKVTNDIELDFDVEVEESEGE